MHSLNLYQTNSGQIWLLIGTSQIRKVSLKIYTMVVQKVRSHALCEKNFIHEFKAIHNIVRHCYILLLLRVTIIVKAFPPLVHQRIETGIEEINIMTCGASSWLLVSYRLLFWNADFPGSSSTVRGDGNHLVPGPWCMLDVPIPLFGSKSRVSEFSVRRLNAVIASAVQKRNLIIAGNLCP